jgi:hypothetical protein
MLNPTQPIPLWRYGARPQRAIVHIGLEREPNLRCWGPSHVYPRWIGFGASSPLACCQDGREGIFIYRSTDLPIYLSIHQHARANALALTRGACVRALWAKGRAFCNTNSGLVTNTTAVESRYLPCEWAHMRACVLPCVSVCKRVCVRACSR